MKSKLNFVIWIDRYDYVSGYNNFFHSLAENLHDIGENVYTLGVGKKNFKYKIFPIKGFDPTRSIQFDIDNPDTGIIFDFKNSGLDPESTIFITHHIIDYKYLLPFKSVRLVCDPDSRYDRAPYDKDKTLFFYHLKGYSTKDLNCDGFLRWLDIDTCFWYPKSISSNKNTYLVKKLTRYLSENEIHSHINYNLKQVFKISPYNFENIDRIAGEIHASNDTDKSLISMQRLAWSNSDFFVSFDQITAQTIFASLCGAKTIIIPSKNSWFPEYYQPDEFRELFYPYASPGIAYGLNDLDYMYNTRHLLRQHIKDSKTVYKDDIKKFVKTCYEKF